MRLCGPSSPSAGIGTPLRRHSCELIKPISSRSDATEVVFATRSADRPPLGGTAPSSDERGSAPPEAREATSVGALDAGPQASAQAFIASGARRKGML